VLDGQVQCDGPALDLGRRGLPSPCPRNHSVDKWQDPSARVMRPSSTVIGDRRRHTRRRCRQRRGILAPRGLIPFRDSVGRGELPPQEVRRFVPGIRGGREVHAHPTNFLLADPGIAATPNAEETGRSRLLPAAFDFRSQKVIQQPAGVGRVGGSLEDAQCIGYEQSPIWPSFWSGYTMATGMPFSTSARASSVSVSPNSSCLGPRLPPPACCAKHLGVVARREKLLGALATPVREQDSRVRGGGAEQRLGQTASALPFRIRQLDDRRGPVVFGQQILVHHEHAGTRCEPVPTSWAER